MKKKKNKQRNNLAGLTPEEIGRRCQCGPGVLPPGRFRAQADMWVNNMMCLEVQKMPFAHGVAGLAFTPELVLAAMNDECAFYGVRVRLIEREHSQKLEWIRISDGAIVEATEFREVEAF